MSKRLIKIAKELNVGVGTIVDFLTDNGFAVENKPTAKVSPEMENALTKEFQKSIAIKERADQIKIGRVAKKEADATLKDSDVIVAPPPPTPPKVDSTSKSNIILNKDNNRDSSANSKEEVITAERSTPILSKPKILGNISLGGLGRKKETNQQQKEEKPKAKPVEKSVPNPIIKKISEPIQKENKEEQKVIEPVKVIEPIIVKKETEERTVDKVQREESTKIPAPISTSKAKPQPEKPPKVVEEVVAQGDGKPELIKADAPELRGLKIKGKIDIDKFSRKPKKKDKTKKDGGSGTSDPKNPSSARSEDSRRRRRKRKKVTTDTNTPGQKQQTTSPSSSGGQRTGGGTGGNRTQSGGNRSQGGGNRTQSGGNRSQGGGNRTQGGGNRNRGGNSSNQRSGGRRDDRPKEVSQKEIDEKIKATMARLSGGGKKKRQKLRRGNRERQREKQEQIDQEQETEIIQLTEFISVSELASLLDIGATDVITSCMNMGVIVSINQRLDAEIIELIAEEHDKEIEFISAEEQIDEEEEIIDDPADLISRAPIVTVMGHVDHGKTSLLDYIRESTVAEGEAGGITQHIGAYEVLVGEAKKRITFLDTPGHEAFTAMRARGAKVTDIAIIIIAADDNIMPQTKEAISHAQAAGVPMIFAINKIDKSGANPDNIKQALAGMNLLVEDWGGNFQSQDISAKMGTGVEELLEKITLEAEILELKANPKRKAVGAILEASLDRGRGYVTKTLIQTGTLHVGDPVVAGEYSGKVKAMFNEHGKRVTVAGPSKPVLVLGLNGAPQAGERFKETENESEARQIASKRGQINREQANRATKRISLDEIGRRLALGTFKELNLIVKGDFDGSIEALSDSLIKQSIETVQVNVIHKAVGQIIESDVLLASASDAIIIGFQVRPSMNARKLAEREGVQIRTYSIIYEAINEVRSAIEGMLEPTKEERIVCNVEIREVYKISKVGTIAGCYVLDGKITRNTSVRVVRDGIVVYPTKENVVGEIASLRKFKDDAKEVKAGVECGLNVKNFNDIKVGDIIEGYEIVEVKQTLD